MRCSICSHSILLSQDGRQVTLAKDGHCHPILFSFALPLAITDIAVATRGKSICPRLRSRLFKCRSLRPTPTPTTSRPEKEATSATYKHPRRRAIRSQAFASGDNIQQPERDRHEQVEAVSARAFASAYHDDQVHVPGRVSVAEAPFVEDVYHNE